MAVRIERVKPRNDIAEKPVCSVRGYELVATDVPAPRHHVENSTFVSTIEEAAALVEQGYSIRMGRPGKRASLIASSSLRVIRY
jgi:hypothetical protein